MSELDIPKGGDWRKVLKENLKDAKAGIICLTPDNLESPYVLFECGFLSAEEERLVCPYLLGLEDSDVRSPLADLQLTGADRGDTYKMLSDLNNVLDPERVLAKEVLEDAFGKRWNELDRQLKGIMEQGPQKRKKPGTGELLEEILATVRSISRSLPISEERAVPSKASSRNDLQAYITQAGKRLYSLVEQHGPFKGIDPDIMDLSRYLGHGDTKLASKAIKKLFDNGSAEDALRELHRVIIAYELAATRL